MVVSGPILYEPLAENKSELFLLKQDQ
jgi:hypothetical protein